MGNYESQRSKSIKLMDSKMKHFQDITKKPTVNSKITPKGETSREQGFEIQSPRAKEVRLMMV